MKILIVGAGSIGTRHIRNLLSLKNNLELHVIDSCKRTCRKIQKIFNLKTFLSIDDAIKDNIYMIAFICSPNHLHITHAKKLASVNCNLFIEKPLAINLKEAQSLKPYIKNKNLKVMVGCNLRFHPGVIELKNVISKQLIGRPLYARAFFGHYLANWRPGINYIDTYSAYKKQGGGILLDAIHEPDYLSWLLGSIKKANGFLKNIGDLNIEVEDIAEYTAWHGKKVYSQIHVDYLRQDKTRICEIIGTKGSVVWKSYGKTPEVIKVDFYKSANSKWQRLYENKTYDANDQYLSEVKYVINQLKSYKELMNGLNESISLIKVLDKLKFKN